MHLLGVRFSAFSLLGPALFSISCNPGPTIPASNRQSINLGEVNAITIGPTGTGLASKYFKLPNDLVPNPYGVILGKEEFEIIYYTNWKRRAGGLGFAFVDPVLVNASRKQALYNAKYRNYNGHSAYLLGSENACCSGPVVMESRAIVDMWVESPPHYSNLMNGTAMGAGVGMEGSDVVHWIEEFR